MSAALAIRDGCRDARAGRKPYLATLLASRQERMGSLREGANATARVVLLGVVMDAMYQAQVLQRFYPHEAVIVALLLAFVPYLLVRGLALRVARRRGVAS